MQHLVEDDVKLSLHKKDFLTGLQRVAGVPSKKAVVPSLSCVLLDAEDDVVLIGATDLTVSVEVTVACTASEPMHFGINAKDLLDRVRQMPDALLTVKLDAEHCRATLTAAGSPRKYVLPFIPGDDFPALPHRDINWDGASVINSAQLRKLIATTEHAISADITRPHLSSLLVQWDDTVVRAVATDGHRLAKCELVGISTAKARSMLIPSKGVAEIRRALDAVAEDEAIVEIAGTERDVLVRTNGWTMVCRLVDATFPAYEQVIPKKQPNRVVAQRALLIDAVKSVSVAANESSGGLSFRIADGKLKVEAESVDRGLGEDEIAVEQTGGAVHIGFNAGFVLDALGVIDTEEVEINLSGELDPAVLRPVADKPSVLLVLMPIRL